MDYWNKVISHLIGKTVSFEYKDYRDNHIMEVKDYLIKKIEQSPWTNKVVVNDELRLTFETIENLIPIDYLISTSERTVACNKFKCETILTGLVRENIKYQVFCVKDGQIVEINPDIKIEVTL